MAKKFDKIIVVDLEATCWDMETEEGLAEKGDQEPEIIEIGICAFYPESGNIADKRSILVRPVRSKVSQYCTDLTGHTWESLRKNGVPFEGALNTVRRHYGPKHRVMAAWGNYDWYHISLQCLQEDLKFPFGRSMMNVKELYAIKFKLEKALGLGLALEHANMEFMGTPHHGDDDAFNTARLLKKTLED